MTWKQLLTLIGSLVMAMFTLAYLMHERLDRMNERTDFLYKEIGRVDRDTRDLNVEIVLLKCRLNPNMCGDGN